tara:strand:- start:184 stop:654 length:471 start_codon:yes stop_codon:yes gene_type:complete
MAMRQWLELKIPPLLLALIVAGLMWVMVFITPSTPFPLMLRVPLTVLLASAGVYFMVSGVLTFKLAETTVNPIRPETASSLVTHGVYRLSRNPMYLGFLLCLLGWGFLLGNLFSLLLAGGFAWYMTELQIKPEETALIQRFGDSYKDYLQKTRRWI